MLELASAGSSKKLIISNCSLNENFRRKMASLLSVYKFLRESEREARERSVFLCVCVCVPEVNDAALYCYDSNDHQSAKHIWKPQITQCSSKERP